MGEIIDQITTEMRKRTEKKFSSWDEVLRRGFLKEGHRKEKYAYGLLNDPTIFTYAFDLDEDSNPFKMYPYQDMFMNDTNKRALFAGANQIGKTLPVMKKAKHFALTRPGTITMVFSKTYTLSKDFIYRIKGFMKSSTLDYDTNTIEADNKTELHIRHFDRIKEDGKWVDKELKNSRIISVPATEGALSYPANLVIMDEIAFYENSIYVYYQIAQPRTYTTKGQIMFVSNPNGRRGVFWDLWQNPMYSRYQFNFLDKPGNTQAEWDFLKKDLPSAIFDSTVASIFTDTEGGFFTWQERKIMFDNERVNQLPILLTKPIYIAIDWGKVKDRTVVAMGHREGLAEFPWIHVPFIKEYPQKFPNTRVLEELYGWIQAFKPHNVAMLGWDNTGYGGGLEDYMIRIENMGVVLNPVVFSLESKSRMYTLFKVLAERNVKGIKGISLPRHDEADRQLSNLIFTTTSRGHLKVKHMEDSDRDDIPDALAILCSMIINPENPPVTATIISEDEDGEYVDPYNFPNEFDDISGVI